MRMPPIVLTLLAGCWVFVCGLHASSEPVGASVDGNSSLVATNRLWFQVGEELVYAGYWGPLTVGEARLWTEWVEEGGRKLLAIKFIAKSSYVVSALYPVNDALESIVDPETFLPLRLTQNIREGDKERDDTITFDHKAGKAVWKSCRAASTNASKEIAIQADTRDILSFMFYMRVKSFVVGKTEASKLLFDDKEYQLTVTGLKYEDVYLSHFGDVRCLEIEPKAKFGEVFVKKGSINMWISDDERRICTKAMAVVPVANVKMVLQSVKGSGDDFWTSGKKKKK
ncbi:MAG: DUF3108 domain-containing protein [bacterium]